MANQKARSWECGL